MAKFFKKIGWLLALLVLLNMLYLAVLICFCPGFKKVYEVHQFKNQHFDVLILGNSMALDAVDAQVLSQKGISSYNMAIAGDHISTSLFMLEEYLKNNKKPKVVAIGLSSAIGKSYLNPVAFKNPEVEFFYHPDLLSNITNPPLLNFQWLAVDMLKIVISKDHRNAKMILGQWKTGKVIPDTSTFKAKTHSIDYTNPYLSQTIEMCHSKGIRVVLFELPGSNANQNALPFYYQAKLKNGKPFLIRNLNNNEIMSHVIDPKTDWLAPDHLNKHGGEKITQFIGAELVPQINTTR